MIWMDFNIMQAGSNFTVMGDTDTEVMDKGLYSPGDIYVVNEKGWLIKQQFNPGDVLMATRSGDLTKVAGQTLD